MSASGCVSKWSASTLEITDLMVEFGDDVHRRGCGGPEPAATASGAVRCWVRRTVWISRARVSILR